MLYNGKNGLAPAFLFYNILIFFLYNIQVINCQLPGLPRFLPPIPNILPPVPGVLPPIPNILPPVPGLLPPIPNLPGLIPPISNILPPVPGLLPPIPNLPGLLPPIPNLPGLLPPIPGFLPPIPNIPGLPTTPAKPEPTCPKNSVRLRIVCARVLGVPVLPIGSPFNPLASPCCKFIEGLIDIEVAVCFCRALTFNNVEPRFNVPLSLVVLLNYCQKEVPPGFRCATS